MLEEFKDKKILILGLGREGLDNFKFLRKLFPDKILGVGDRLGIENLKPKTINLIKKDKKTKFHLGRNYLNSVENYDIIIKSPGIPIHLPETEKAYKEKKITSQTEIFFNHCPGKIIGVTGTKGKSTTSALIYNVLKQGGIKTHLVGNIGKPVLSLLFRARKNDVYIYELSSHQLYGLKKSPHIAVFLNIFKEHLDYYKNFNEYLRAKENICRHQKRSDYLIYNPRNKYLKKAVEISGARKIPIKIEKIKKLIGEKNFPFWADFYFLNAGVAMEAGKILNIPLSRIQKAIRSFKPLKHRLEYVGTFKGVRFYNDSLSTIPETTILAIDSLKNSLETIILGGFDRGQDFSELAERILDSKIRNIILFPTTGKRIQHAISTLNKRRRPFNYFPVDNIKKAVLLSYRYTKNGRICLLSPASPSFGLFQDYKERGNLFKRYIKYYAGEKKT